jgi:hypothetical protein
MQYVVIGSTIKTYAAQYTLNTSLPVFNRKRAMQMSRQNQYIVKSAQFSKSKHHGFCFSGDWFHPK